MSIVALPVPPSLAGNRGHLREFFSGMIRKLDINSHKDVPNRKDLGNLLAGVMREIGEFHEQLEKDRLNPNTLIELMDAANFLFLTYVALRNDGTKTRLEQWFDEWYDIRPKQGKIYCKKTKMSSKYRKGDEIMGSLSNGRVRIKILSYRMHWGSNTIPRSHLMWWKAKGHWPTMLLDHKNLKSYDDRIANLRDVSFTINALNKKIKRQHPHFVHLYAPSTRKNDKNYGKFFYKRHYDGRNIVVCYFDTAQQASKQGEIKWVKRVKEMEKQ